MHKEAYRQGFIDRCASHGVDPDVVVKMAFGEAGELVHMPPSRRDQTDSLAPKPGDDPMPSKDRGPASNRNKIDPDMQSTYAKSNAVPKPAKSMPVGASSVSVNSKQPIVPAAGTGMSGET